MEFSIVIHEALISDGGFDVKNKSTDLDDSLIDFVQS